MATRRRKPGRPKGSKNKKRSKAKSRAKSSRRKSKATPAQLRNLKKARAARMKNLKAAGKGSKKTVKKMTKKRREQLKANLQKARAARELKNMPKTQRMALKQLHHDMMADTVRGPAIVVMPEHQLRAGAPSILQRVRRHMPTMMSRYN